MIKLNRIVKALIFYDFLIYSSWGLISPVYAIFILREVQGGNAKIVGIGVGIYWILKGIFQFPIGKYLDKYATRRTNINFIIIGTLISTGAAAGYLFAVLPWHIYVLAAVQAVGLAMVVPPWGGVFMRHIDKGKESESWSLENSLLGVGMGAASLIAGFVVAGAGFKILFGAIVFFHLCSVFLVVFLRDKIIGDPRKPAARPTPTK